MQPLLFTVEFRRKMARLSQAQRLEWLASLAARARQDPSPRLEQELREVARGCRLPLAESLPRQHGHFDAAHLQAIVEVPRERFVREEDVERSAEDAPLPLDDQGLATVSAPHAYLLTYRLLELAPGDALVELGSGSGYGAALASFIVGERGHVTTFEIDGALARRATALVRDRPNVEVHHHDAVMSAPLWGGALKAAVTFAVSSLPAAWLAALPEGGRLVAPVGAREGEQRLVLSTRRHGRLVETDHGAVRYVRNRSTR